LELWRPPPSRSLASSPGLLNAHPGVIWRLTLAMCRFIMEPWRSVLEPWRPLLEPWRLTLGPWSHSEAMEAQPGAVEAGGWSLACSPLKGPKLEIFSSRVFPQIRPVCVGDLGTRRKNSILMV
jgi:hypothetical protein